MSKKGMVSIEEAVSTGEKGKSAENLWLFDNLVHKTRFPGRASALLFYVFQS
jgi:hypothetical protein